VYIETYSKTLFDMTFLDLLLQDLNMIIICFVLVILGVIIKYKSWFIGINTILITLFGLPIAQIINRGIFGVTYFSWHFVLINFVTFFLVSCNTFWFFDQWVATARIPIIKDSPKKRLVYTMAKTMKLNSITSVVIGLGYFTPMLSQLEQMKAIGTYTGILVLVNYVMMMIFFPAILMVYEVYIVHSPCSMHNIRKGCLKLMANCCRGKEKKDTISTRVGQKVEEIIVEYDKNRDMSIGKGSNFFISHWNQFTRKFRWAVIGLGLAWFVIAMVNVNKVLRQSKKQEQIETSNWVETAKLKQQTNFEHQMDNSFISLFVIGINREHEQLEDYAPVNSDIHNSIFDPEFDRFTSAESQDFLFDLCQEVLNEPAQDIKCWIKDFAKWYYVPVVNVTEPEFYSSTDIPQGDAFT
jgi:hypothetical protein